MNWQEILTILIPILGLMAWVYNRIEKKSDERFDLAEKKSDEKFALVFARLDKIDNKLEKVDERLQNLDMRLTRLEGRFDERGYWESREFHKTGTDDKK